MSGLTKVSETYGNNNYVAFENANRERYLAERIEAYGVIQFGAMAKDTTKSISLQSLTSPVSLKSVYLFSSTTTNDEVKFKIYQELTSGSLDLIATQQFNNNEMPFPFPEGAILFPHNTIEVEPRYDVDNILIYVKLVDILFTIDYSDF